MLDQISKAFNRKRYSGVHERNSSFGANGFSRLWCSAALCFVCVMAVTACSTHTIHESEPEVTRTVEKPQFSGPWAQEFSDAFDRAQSNSEQLLLADEFISDQEKEAVTDEFRACLELVGIEFDDFRKDGSYEFGLPPSGNPDEANKRTDACAEKSGVNTVVTLYFNTRSNPENVDQTEAIVACLKRARAVDDSYTEADQRAGRFFEQTVGDPSAALEASLSCTANPNQAFRE